MLYILTAFLAAAIGTVMYHLYKHRRYQEESQEIFNQFLDEVALGDTEKARENYLRRINNRKK